MKLILKNNVDKKEYEFSVTDLEDSGMFWHFNINLVDGMPDGEYSYVLYDNDNKQVAEGLLQIGDYEIKQQEQPVYTNNNNEYIQYNG
jgi:hypothetical protein